MPEFANEREKNIKFQITLNEEQKQNLYGYIYKITSPNGRIYIGLTNNINKRYNSYASEKCKSQPKIYKSIKKYEFKNHFFDIIDFANSKKELEEKEIYYIKNYNSFENGLNCTRGGEGIGKGHIPWNKGLKGVILLSAETIEKIRLKNKGKVRTDEAKQKYKESKLGEKNPMFNKPQSDEVNLKKSVNSARARKIINIETNEIYNSILEAAKSNNINSNTLQYQLTKNKNKYLKFYV
jgi:group I intron endonuclease